MKVIILAGGRGSRMGEQTDVIPKPLVTIGGKPIIEHIMMMFQENIGDCKFVISAGYKHEVISDHFQDRDDVLVFDTGLETQTAGRLWKLRHYLAEPFYFCYGDGLTDYNLYDLRMGVSKTEFTTKMLVVHPMSRFGEVEFNARGKVVNFSEKPISSTWINGGFFYTTPDIFKFIHKESDILEEDVLPIMTAREDLGCDSYDGFWHCMDTPKARKELEDLYNRGEAKWLK